MKITKTQLEEIIMEELSNYLSNIYKLCPAGTKCAPESKKTKWWKGPDLSEDLEQRTGPAPGRGTEIAAQSVPEKAVSTHQGASKYDNDQIRTHCRQTYDPDRRSTEDYSKCVRSLGGMAE